MKTIHKYTIPHDPSSGEYGCYPLTLPVGAKLLHVEPLSLTTFWAEVDTDQPMRTRSIFVSRTGHNLYSHIPMRYFKTILSNGFVCHIHVEAASGLVGGEP